MTKISPKAKTNILKQINNGFKKTKPISCKSANTSKLERTPLKDYFFDYSTEAEGFFTKKETKTGRILEVFPLMFPR